jgi:rod shape-determining protein MreC
MRFIYTKTFIRIFVIFIIVALLAISDATGYLGYVKGGFFRVYGYTANKLANVTGGIKHGFETLLIIKNLAKDNGELNNKVDQLAFENARLKSAQDENIVLRKALNFQQQTNLKLLPVEVLNSDPTGFTQTIVIDKGQNYNLNPGQAVVSSPGLLVGKITKVYSNTSEVMLITDPSMVVNSEVVDSGAHGLIRGEHGLGLSLDLVTQNELIKSGDEVITSGLSSDFPRGLLIGNVSAIRSSKTELFQKAFVQPSADLRTIRFLFVVL